MDINVEVLAKEIAGYISPRFPQSIELWDAKLVGDYLGVIAEYVLGRYAPRGDFPKSYRLPAKSGRGHPRWKAEEIIDWIERYREKK
jgi:hypothetical protein